MYWNMEQFRFSDFDGFIRCRMLCVRFKCVSIFFMFYSFFLSFEYAVKNRKPYINAVSDLQDNPEKGKFWFLYVMKNGQPTLAQESKNWFI